MFSGVTRGQEKGRKFFSGLAKGSFQQSPFQQHRNLWKISCHMDRLFIFFPLCRVWLAPRKQRLSLACLRCFLWRDVKAPTAGVLWLWDWMIEGGYDRLLSWPHCSEPSACQVFSATKREADTALLSSGMSLWVRSTTQRVGRIQIKWNPNYLNRQTGDI